MGSLTFKLEKFEGPLDLLLYLIAKHKLDIYDIEITLLLDQYLEYIDSLEEQDFDAAGDFLAMAARLVYIKTCSLLPQAEEAEEMKKELQGELIEYSACRDAALRLKNMSVYGEVFVRPPEKIPVNKVFTGNVDPQRLVDAYMGMSAKARSMKPVRAEQFSPIVAARIVTVTSKIVHVLKKLHKCGECSVEELYEDVTDKSARVATFLAVLELAKSGRIYLNEENTMIYFNRESPRRHTSKDKSGEQKERSAEISEEIPEPPIFIDDTQEEVFEETSESKLDKSENTDCSGCSDISEIAEIEEDTADAVDAEVSEISDNSNTTGAALAISSRSFSIAVTVRECEEIAAEADDLSENKNIAADEPTVCGDKHKEEIVRLAESCETAKAEEDQPPVDETDEIVGKSTPPKRRENRFSRRYRWHTAADVKNCWIYRREKV